MPWELTTPLQTGDLDPNGPYAQIKIMRFLHDSRRNQISMSLEYGNTINGVWVQGKDPDGLDTHVIINDSDYITLVTTHASNDGELTYDATKRGLYEWLSTNNMIGAGTIV